MTNESELISVIVPVYNTEKFLPKCIKSILEQTYNNIQIILIDDGSKDSSLKICEQYAKKDKRIRVIHQSNSGVANAKNRGLSIAKGEYLTFIDSDDWIARNAIEVLHKSLKENNSQLAIGSTKNIACFGSQFLYPPINTVINCDDKAQLSKYSFRGGNYFPPTAAKLFVRSIIEDNNLRFNTDITYSEDGIFNFRYINCIKKISIIPDTVYYYNRLNSTSITTKYYPLLNGWLLEVQRTREELFRDSLDCTVVRERLINYALVLFRKLCIYYSNHGLDTEVAVKKIEETCRMFSDYLNQSKSVKIESNLEYYVYDCYNDYLNNDYLSIYLRFHTEEHSNVLNNILRHIKYFIMNRLAEIKYIWLFKICEINNNIGTD